jgi:hypothetical protein
MTCPALNCPGRRVDVGFRSTQLPATADGEPGLMDEVDGLSYGKNMFLAGSGRVH